MVISVNVDDVTLESTVQVPTVIKSFALSLYGSMHKIEPIYFQLSNALLHCFTLLSLYIALHCFHFTLPFAFTLHCLLLGERFSFHSNYFTLTFLTQNTSNAKVIYFPLFPHSLSHHLIFYSFISYQS